jgi:CheY-like chemotaxis protein
MQSLSTHLRLQSTDTASWSLMRINRSRSSPSAANDGETAIEIIRALKPDVVLTSIEVPKLDGFEIAREIRRLMPESPFIIAMTGYNREYISMRGGDTAFDLVLLKPLVITDLWDSLARLHECPRKRLTPKVALKS